MVIGYGFGDEHINGILQQALRGGKEKRLVAVTWFGDQLNDTEKEKAAKRFKCFIVKQLGLEGEEDQRLVLLVHSGQTFLEKELTLAAMASHFPPEESLFEEVSLAT